MDNSLVHLLETRDPGRPSLSHLGYVESPGVSRHPHGVWGALIITAEMQRNQISRPGLSTLNLKPGRIWEEIRGGERCPAPGLTLERKPALAFSAFVNRVFMGSIASKTAAAKASRYEDPQW